MNNDFLVCVRCITYNHSAYIEDTMNGFTMQQTDFPFVCIIIDDFSTDGEPEVIQRYLKQHFDLDDKSVVLNEETDDYVMSFAQHKDNKNCFFAIYYLKYNHYRKKDKRPYYASFEEHAKYIAICEGDDYWIDPMKLQKQKDVFDEYPDVGLVHTDYNLVSGKRKHFNCSEEPRNCLMNLLVSGRYDIGTLTVMYRKVFYDKIPKRWIGKGFLMGDSPLFIELASVSDFVYLNRITACYRVLPESVSHSKNIDWQVKFRKSGMEINEFYCNVFNLPYKADWRMFYYNIMREIYRNNNIEDAKKYYKEASENNSLSFKTRLLYLGTIIPAFRYCLEKGRIFYGK